jgi:hypothetical protein
MRGRRHRPGTECVRHSGACSFLPRARLRCSVCGWMTADACEIEKCALRGRYGGPRASRRARGTADELKILLATKPREEQIAELVSVLIEYRQDMLYSLLRGPNAGCILTDAAPARMGVRLWALPLRLREWLAIGPTRREQCFGRPRVQEGGACRRLWEVRMSWLAATLRKYPEMVVLLSLGIGYWVGGKRYRGFNLFAGSQTISASMGLATDAATASAFSPTTPRRYLTRCRPPTRSPTFFSARSVRPSSLQRSGSSCCASTGSLPSRNMRQGWARRKISAEAGPAWHRYEPRAYRIPKDARSSGAPMERRFPCCQVRSCVAGTC